MYSLELLHGHAIRQRTLGLMYIIPPITVLKFVCIVVCVKLYNMGIRNRTLSICFQCFLFVSLCCCDEIAQAYLQLFVSMSLFPCCLVI